jgi:gliding motility-associated protein GldM
MSGNHPSELSPRQRMINMMYLVLTALLALNVSKEVLQSFFEVNKGIERTTTNFNLKNGETYAAFDNAAENNPEKYQEVKDKAYTVKKIADEVTIYIQEMKYDLVSKCDKGEVYLGKAIDILDEDGKPKEEKAQVDKAFNELTDEQKRLPIGVLNNKSDRDGAGDLFFPKHLAGKNKRATILKNKINEYKSSLTQIANNEKSLIANINLVCDISDKTRAGKDELWEEYNFVDMPSVGALTILSKIQSDMRNVESDAINYLKRNIDAKSLKFTSAEGIQIPKTNFVLRGDSFRSEIFITAKNENQNPEIYVGEYDSLGGGKYEMRGEKGVDYETVKVVNGKGMFATRTRTDGSKKWGGLIAMKTETGTKFYPFSGEYLVAAKTAVVSPVNMNILYLEVDNPLKISVPGYAAGEISAVMTNGKVTATKKSLGEWAARPKKEGKALISLYAEVEGKRTKMGDMEFRVKEVPPPKAKVDFTKLANGSLIISKSNLLNAGGVQAKLKDFDFKGVRYIITSYRLTGIIKGEQTFRETRGGQFSDKMATIIKNTKAGNSITISNIKAKRIDYKNNKEVLLDPLILEIK